MRPTEDIVERFAKARFEARSGLHLWAGQSWTRKSACGRSVKHREKIELNDNAR